MIRWESSITTVAWLLNEWFSLISCGLNLPVLLEWTQGNFLTVVSMMFDLFEYDTHNVWKRYYYYSQPLRNILGIFAKCSLSVAMFETFREQLGEILKEKIVEKNYRWKSCFWVKIVSFDNNKCSSFGKCL